MNRDTICTDASCAKQATKKEKTLCEAHYRQWLRKQPKCKAPGCKALPAGHGYCRPHERLALTTRTKAMQDKSLARFREGIEADWETGCWLWVERPNEDGYAQFHAGGHWYAHRFAYVWFIGGHERRKTLDHLCNVKRCVRPDHLWAISNTLNSKLRYERALAGARAYWQDSWGMYHRAGVEAWAAANGLPYGDLPPFGRDGRKPPRASALEMMPHLHEFREAARLHPAWEPLSIGQYDLFQTLKVSSM